MSNPMDTVEVAVEQRLVGLFSATNTLTKLSKGEGRKIISRPKCVEELAMVRDQLSRILKDIANV